MILNKEGKLLRILKVARHCCIRVIRFAEALKSVGYEVDLLTNKIAYGTVVFDQITFYHNKKQFQNYKLFVIIISSLPVLKLSIMGNDRLLLVVVSNLRYEGVKSIPLR